MGVTPEYVLYKMSYQNVLLYSHATPTYDYDSESEKKEFDASLDANNPDNFKGMPDEEIITSLH